MYPTLLMSDRASPEVPGLTECLVVRDGKERGAPLAPRALPDPQPSKVSLVTQVSEVRTDPQDPPVPGERPDRRESRDTPDFL